MLAANLKAHASDQLGGRWDQFFRFGLQSVCVNAQLSEVVVSSGQDVVIDAMEPLLIESLEPPLNGKFGDNFALTEHLQAFDPQIAAERRKAFAEEIMKGGVTWSPEISAL